MTASNHGIQAGGDHRPCYTCAMGSTVYHHQAAYDTVFFCNRHSSSLNEQLTLQGPLAHSQDVVVANGDIDLPISLAPLSISGLSESSSASYDTMRAATNIGRADLVHILGRDYFSMPEPNELTENAIRALNFNHAQTYPFNTYGWVYDGNKYDLPPKTNADLPQMTDSMLVSKPAKKSASSINTSSWYLVDRPGEQTSHTTDEVVFAAGAQYENDTAYPYTIDEAIFLGH